MLPACRLRLRNEDDLAALAPRSSARCTPAQQAVHSRRPLSRYDMAQTIRRAKVIGRAGNEQRLSERALVARPRHAAAGTMGALIAARRSSAFVQRRRKRDMADEQLAAQHPYPDSSRFPAFGSPNVTVQSARTATPITCPVSPLTPDGMSMLNTAAFAAIDRPRWRPHRRLPPYGRCPCPAERRPGHRPSLIAAGRRIPRCVTRTTCRCPILARHCRS